MSTTTTQPETSPATTTPIVRVSVPQRSLRSELRAIKIVWRRELIRYRSDRHRRPFRRASRSTARPSAAITSRVPVGATL